MAHCFFSESGRETTKKAERISHDRSGACCQFRLAGNRTGKATLYRLGRRFND
jgi:hypothetical protein